MKDTILAISGKPGLYRLISSGRNMLIVESIDAEKRRIPAGARDRVTSLTDVTMYTTTEDTPLMKIFQNIADRYEAKPVPLHHKTSGTEELEAFMSEVLPEYDKDRVHISDIRKLVQWYNILIAGGITKFWEEEEQTEA